MDLQSLKLETVSTLLSQSMQDKMGLHSVKLETGADHLEYHIK